MGTLAQYLQRGLAKSMAVQSMMTTTITVGATTITVLRDSANIALPFFDGGTKPSRTIQVTGKRADVATINADPYQIVNSIATMDGKQWRVADVMDGDVAVRMTLEEVDA
jgi:hypothetical protein